MNISIYYILELFDVLFSLDPPTPALIEQVRNLYQHRVPDVRFLIPVLNGLTKKEVLAVLPKLIKLNPDVVKRVFQRLLGSQVIASFNNEFTKCMQRFSP